MRWTQNKITFDFGKKQMEVSNDRCAKHDPGKIDLTEIMDKKFIMADATK